MREKSASGKREGISYCLPPFSLPPDPLPLSTPATQAINRPSSSLVHMLARDEAN